MKIRARKRNPNPVYKSYTVYVQPKMALSSMGGLEPVALTDLKSGDQVALKRKVELETFHPSFKILNPIVGNHYYHHGIFIEPHHIIHQEWLFGTGQFMTRACKEDINRLMRGISVDGTIYKVACDEQNSLPMDEVIKKGEEMVSAGVVEQFNIVTNNCETFATFLKTGKRTSSQVHKVCQLVKTAAPEVFAVLSPLLNVDELESKSSALEEELDLD